MIFYLSLLPFDLDGGGGPMGRYLCLIMFVGLYSHLFFNYSLGKSHPLQAGVTG